MLPVLYTIGTFNVYSFGLFLALSFLVSTFIVWRFARDELKEEEYLDAYLSTCIASVVFARVTYIAFHFEEFGSNILSYALVRLSPGLSLFGGLFGGLVFLWWYVKKRKMKFLHTADMFGVAFSLAVGIAKIGEQLGGGGYGRETDWLLGVSLKGKEGRFHPVELYESVAFFILFAITYSLYQKTKRKHFRDGFVAQIFSFLSLTIIFVLEFIKVGSVYYNGLSIRQIAILLCLLFLAIPMFSSMYIRFFASKRSTI